MKVRYTCFIILLITIKALFGLNIENIRYNSYSSSARVIFDIDQSNKKYHITKAGNTIKIYFSDYKISSRIRLPISPGTGIISSISKRDIYSDIVISIEVTSSQCIYNITELSSPYRLIFDIEPREMLEIEKKEVKDVDIDGEKLNYEPKTMWTLEGAPHAYGGLENLEKEGFYEQYINVKKKIEEDKAAEDTVTAQVDDKEEEYAKMKEDKTKNIYEKMDKFFKNKEYQKVIAQYDELDQDFKNNNYFDDALFLVAKAYFYSNNLESATKMFQRIIKDYPDYEYNMFCYYFLGDISYQKEEWSKAPGYLNKYLKNAEPRYKENAWNYLFFSYFNQDRKSEAFITLRQIFKDFPDYNYNEDYRYRFCNLTLELIKSVKQKISCLEAFIADYPKSEHLGEYYYILGELYEEDKQYSVSAENYRKSVDTGYEERPYVELQIANMLYKSYQDKEAISYYKMVAENEENPQAHRDLARTQIMNILKRGKSHRDIIDYMKMIDEGKYKFEIAIKHYYLKEYDDAKSYFFKVMEDTLSSNDNLHLSYLYLGNIYYFEKKFPLANKYYDKYYNFADNLYKESQEENKEFDNTKYELDWVMLQKANSSLFEKDYDKASDAYKELLDRFPLSKWKKEAEWGASEANWEKQLEEAIEK